MRIPFPYSAGILSVSLSTTALLIFTTLRWQPIHAQTIGSVEQLAVSTTPAQLPAANQKIVATVYPFRLSADQPLQPTKNTAKTTASPDYTTIFFEVLRTSGWFVPVEYNNVDNLINGQPTKPSVPSTAVESSNPAASQGPTIILEAGLFSHDANALSDEEASKYVTNRVSNRYRQDRATVFIRALSAQSGKVLKTIYWTRTVLSQPVDATTYRYMLVNHFNIIHTGTTTISPDQIAIVEAMKQAVSGLVIEGVRDGLWVAGNLSAAQTRSIIAAYEAERIDFSEAEKSTALPGKVRPQINPSFLTLGLYGGLMRYHGDYVNWDREGAYGLLLEAYFTPRIGIQLNAATGTLASQNAFTTNLTSLETNLIIRLLPYWRLTPIVYGGVGMVSRSGENPVAFEGNRYLQYQGGIGLQYSLNNVVGFRAMLAYNQPRTDMLDGKRIGNHNDYYVRTTVGLVIHFGQYVPKSSSVARR
jgi:curli production assembly/transport component CsgG